MKIEVSVMVKVLRRYLSEELVQIILSDLSLRQAVADLEETPDDEELKAKINRYLRMKHEQ